MRSYSRRNAISVSQLLYSNSECFFCCRILPMVAFKDASGHHLSLGTPNFIAELAGMSGLLSAGEGLLVVLGFEFNTGQ